MARRVGTVIVGVFCCVMLWHCTGCVTHGCREFTVGILGSEIKVTDCVRTDDQGKQDYKCTFDDENSIVNLIAGGILPKPEKQEEEPAEETALHEPEEPPEG